MSFGLFFIFYYRLTALYGYFSCYLWPNFGPKWVRLAPNGTNRELFQIRFRTARYSEKVPDLSHLGQSDIPYLKCNDIDNSGKCLCTGNIRVFCRVRPVIREDGVEDNAIVVTPHPADQSKVTVLNSQGRSQLFDLDRVFDVNSTQLQVSGGGRGGRFWSKFDQYFPNGTNSGLFQIRFQYIFAQWAKMYWNLIWKVPNSFI